MRRRMFHPEFWRSMRINKLMRTRGPKDVLFYWGLVSNADDEGRESPDLDSLDVRLPLMRLDDEFVIKSLDAIHGLGLIQLYESRNCYFIPDWFEKQTIRKPIPSEYPLPPHEFFLKYPDYFKSLESKYKSIIKLCLEEKKLVPTVCTSNLGIIQGWFTNKVVESSMPKKPAPSKPVVSPESITLENNHSDNALLFLSIIQEYPEWNVVPAKDCEWLEGKELEFHDVDVKFHMMQWSEWIETQYRIKAKGKKKSKFPVNFKTSLHNRLKSARDKNNNEKIKYRSDIEKTSTEEMETPHGF